jgi:hypothetical protein
MLNLVGCSSLTGLNGRRLLGFGGGTIIINDDGEKQHDDGG